MGGVLGFFLGVTMLNCIKETYSLGLPRGNNHGYNHSSQKSEINALNPIKRYGRKSKMILQRKLFEKLKARRTASFRLTKSKRVHFQQLHEKKLMK